MYDVIVVGAGPAGCAAANILSKKGFKVIVFEKTKLPRDKPCGGGIAIRCKKSLELLDIDINEVSLQEYKGFNLSFYDQIAKFEFMVEGKLCYKIQEYNHTFITKIFHNILPQTYLLNISCINMLIEVDIIKLYY